MTQQHNQQQDLLGQVHIAVIRLDAKMDSFTAMIRDLRDTQLDHEQRIRILESLPRYQPERLQALESNHVTPASVKWAVGTIITIASVVIGIIALTLK